MKLLYGSAQNIGRRKEQQDSFYLSEYDNNVSQKKKNLLIAVCDGMGGIPCGKEAARIASDSLTNSFFEKVGVINTSEALIQAVYESNSAVRDLIQSKDMIQEIGTTLVAAAIEDEKLFWVSVGDSHIYQFSNDLLKQLNEDHIFAKVLDAAVNRGVIDKDIADTHYQRDALTSYIGIEDLKKVSSGSVKILPGTSVILCSDGLYKVLCDDEIIFVYDQDPARWANNLIQETLKKNDPHQDNVTCVIITAIS